MHNKRKFKSIISLLTVIGCLMGLLPLEVSATEKQKAADDLAVMPASEKLMEANPAGFVLKENETKIVSVNAEEDGLYNIEIEYMPLQEIVLNSTITVSVGEQTNSVDTRSLWEDSTKEYRKDRYSNEVAPEQVVMEAYTKERLIDSVSLDKTPLEYTLKKGENSIEITNGRAALDIVSIRAVKPQSVRQYSEIFRGESDGNSLLTIEAEDYVKKSDSYIRPKNMQNKALSPYQLTQKKLNVIDDQSFKNPGQWIEWVLDVRQGGNYQLGFRYQQSLKENMPVYASILIDGEIPCQELKSYPFNYTKTEFKNETLSLSGKPMSFWLDEGIHTLRIELDGAPIERFISRVREISSDISDLGIEIGKLSGDKVSAYRNWEIESYFPGITDKLKGYSDELKTLFTEFKQMSGANAKAATNLNLAAENLDMLLKKPKKIPAKLNLLNQGSGSTTQLLSVFCTDVVLQNLSLDRVYVYQNQVDLPRAKVGVVEQTAEGVKRFFSALFSPNSAYSVSKKREGELNIWVNRPINYVQTLQNIADTQFTPETGIPVRLSVMPNEQKMILSNATDTAPDIVLSSTASAPYDLALRGAVTDFTQFPDFADFVSENFNVDALDGYVFEGKIYGMIETQDFFVLMYRKDVMDNLGLKTPETWDDVAEIMPVLRRNSMNFFIPLSNFQGTKPMYAISPFIYQVGASFFTPNGHESLLNSEEAIRGFSTLTDLYSYYSLQPHIPSFYNSFRYATVPIGVGWFGDYVRLMNAAPEIADRWEISYAPGTRQADGSINRAYTAAERSCMIFESSNLKEQSWEFIKWWLSERTQVEFAYLLQTKYGPEYLWNSANLKAFDKLELPQKHKDIILAQWQEIKEVPKHPAGYMLDRELTNAWLGIVTQGMNPRVALDKATQNINREINRKLEEFGYIKEGQYVKDYTIMTAREILFGEK